jgi:hypothetical protein
MCVAIVMYVCVIMDPAIVVVYPCAVMHTGGFDLMLTKVLLDLRVEKDVREDEEG